MDQLETQIQKAREKRMDALMWSNLQGFLLYTIGAILVQVGWNLLTAKYEYKAPELVPVLQQMSPSVVQTLDFFIPGIVILISGIILTVEVYRRCKRLRIWVCLAFSLELVCLLYQHFIHA